MKTDLQRAEDAQTVARDERDRLRLLLEKSDNPQTRARLELAEEAYTAAQVKHAAANEAFEVERDELKRQNIAKAALFDAQAKQALQEQEVLSYNRRKERERIAAEAVAAQRAKIEDAAKKARDRDVQRQLRELALAEKLEAIRKKNNPDA